MFGCPQNLISADKETQNILEYLGSESAKFTNCGSYYSRQLDFQTGRIPNCAELHKVLGTENRNLHYRAFYSDTAQQFVQLPTGKLKDRISQRCEQQGINFGETEESYSSKASFIDDDSLPTFGAKPEGWQAMGKRVKRGQYRTDHGWLVNVNCNGAATIAQKVAVMLGLDLSGISRGDLSAPLRLKLWS